MAHCWVTEAGGPGICSDIDSSSETAVAAAETCGMAGGVGEALADVTSGIVAEEGGKPCDDEA
jgi:hypothetical protein